MNHIVKSKVIIFKASWSSKTPFSMCLQRASKKLSREWKLGHIVYFVLHIYIWECHRVVLGVIWIQTTFHLYAHWLSWGKHPCLNRCDQGKSSYRISLYFVGRAFPCGRQTHKLKCDHHLVYLLYLLYFIYWYFRKSGFDCFFFKYGF